MSDSTPTPDRREMASRLDQVVQTPGQLFALCAPLHIDDTKLAGETLPAQRASLIETIAQQERLDALAAALEAEAARQVRARTSRENAERHSPTPGAYQAQLHFDRAVRYTRQQNYDEALEEYNQAIAADPESGTGYARRAMFNAVLGRASAAQADFAQAIRVAPGNKTAYFDRALWAAKQRQYDQAEADYSAVIALDPEDAEAYKRRGSIYVVRDRTDAALADFTRSLRLNPRDEEVRAWRAELAREQADPAKAGAAANYRALMASVHGRDDEALKHFARAIEVNPRDPLTYSNRGLLYNRQRRYTEALADFNQAIKLDPEQPSAYPGRGQAYAHLERYEDALADYTRAIHLEPTNPEAYEGRSQVYHQLGRETEAQTDRQQARRLAAREAPIWPFSFSIGWGGAALLLVLLVLRFIVGLDWLFAIVGLAILIAILVGVRIAPRFLPQPQSQAGSSSTRK